LDFTVQKDGKWAVFIIEDDGCGIPADRLSKIFDGGLNGTELMDGRRNNMSIGLSVCATIIRAHGGEIQAENRKEGGARFSFSLEMEEMNE
ncbi:MAG TPA: sensor histidine kinase, partial [Candidatus Anaerobutyricum stercoripullorum]|nr:sensor histidine kinase [Candidatus Anaerobutyricum stercoripullorum]